MKLEVWNEPEPTLDAEKLTRVKLVQGDPTVALYAVDVEGRTIINGLIGTLTSRGFHRCEGLSEDLGFALDGQGRILDI